MSNQQPNISNRPRDLSSTSSVQENPMNDDIRDDDYLAGNQSDKSQENSSQTSADNSTYESTSYTGSEVSNKYATANKDEDIKKVKPSGSN
jgi:hypothetical protein